MTNVPRSIVIGTAGHIDHGKTTLVCALTGIDTDRLPEEKRRGITIDLGFAAVEMQAPDGSLLRISFVDVPGHNLFVRNMLAGTGCVPAVMLVIAADEGIMPQTREHLAICQLLGISRGVTVITKADAVSPSQLEEVTNSVRTFLRETFLGLDHSPVLRVSALTGEGLNLLRAELINLALRTLIEGSGALLRLPLDRSFVMKGFGTIVTGTLLSGTVEEGQILHLEPGGRAVRVRGLQTHGHPVQSAQPGSRLAANLSAIDATEIRRGQTLVAPNSLSSVDTVDVEVTLLPGASPLKHRASVHFHAFTSETMATVSLHGYDAMQPGTLRLMRLRLREPIVLVPGDRFVLRQPSPAGTIGGGRVLDAHPELRQRKAVTLAWLEELKAATPPQQVLLRVARRKTSGISFPALSAETGLTRDALLRHVSPALETGELCLVSSDLLLSRKALDSAAIAITNAVQNGPPIKSSELRSQTGLAPGVFAFALNSLIGERRIQLCSEMVSPYSEEPQSSAAGNEHLLAVAKAYESAGLAAPSVLELAQHFKLKETEMRRIVATLLRDKAIVRMGSDDLFIHSAPLDQLAGKISCLRGSVIDIARFKQLTGLSRKYAIPLLEYLDRRRITRKQGDQRLVL